MIPESALQQLKSSLRGQTFSPGDPGYDEARTIPNAMIDRRPALIARCAGAADVVACVRIAREHDILVSVRGGGHSIAGKAVCDGGLMIDMSAMKGIRVDPARRTASCCDLDLVQTLEGGNFVVSARVVVECAAG